MAQKRISVASDHHTNLLISIGWVIGTAGGAGAVGRWATTLIGRSLPRRAASRSAVAAVVPRRSGVDLEQPVGRRLRAEVALVLAAGSCAEALDEVAVVGQAPEGAGQVGRVAGLGVEAGLAVGDDLGQAAEPRGDDGDPERVRLGDDPGEHLVPARRHDERAGSGEDLESAVPRNLAGQLDARQGLGPSAERLLHLTRADHAQPLAAVGEGLRPRLEQHIDAFLRSKAGQADEAAVVRRTRRAGVGCGVELDDDPVGRPSGLQVAAARELGRRDVRVDGGRPRPDGAVERVLDRDRKRRDAG